MKTFLIGRKIAETNPNHANGLAEVSVRGMPTEMRMAPFATQALLLEPIYLFMAILESIYPKPHCLFVLYL